MAASKLILRYTADEAQQFQIGGAMRDLAGRTSSALGRGSGELIHAAVDAA